MSFVKYIFSKAFIKQLLFAIVGLIVLCFIVLWWLKSTTNHGQKIEVPDLAKLTLTDVENVLDENDLRYEILDSANFNPEYPKFSVIEQIPEAGKFVKENRKIYLTLNPSGYRKVKIPNIVGKTRRQAEPTLLNMGFEIGKVTTKPHMSDQVLEIRHKGSKIKPDTELEITSVIDLIVGDESLSRINRDREDGEEEGTETPEGTNEAVNDGAK
ncbi:PASTA domain-containing protein [Marinirhabdus gelatinilytica]|uniref:PASTA domain-containing protein n=1 Tax=Marinirhabdus gelatinilytica TaxID=1703343 RepID=A0A370Q3P4_9FLAO|nr:PASTA domain-containing protein [Marinirhabdus gelatinilytica]RDK82957.1 PASTA domain-containing protein [Marinirhabdus gelatinilytica]